MVVIFNTHTYYDADYGETYEFTFPETYDFYQFIGAGAFGKVFHARDVENNTGSAIKYVDFSRYLDRKHDLPKVIREAMILHYIKNPQVVKLRDIYMAENDIENMKGIYLVMDYCGKNLFTFIKDLEFSLPLEHISYILYHILLGIRYLNSLEIYHRDLKPSNICVQLSENNSIKSVKIIDLGLARPKPRPNESSQLTRNIATVSYRAPEMIIGDKYEKQVDIWSIGCIFGYMLRKDHLFLADKSENSLGNERAMTVQNVIRRVGKPSQTFIDRIEELRNRNVSRIDTAVYKELMRCMQDQDIPDSSDFLDNLFPPNNHDIKDAGVDLLKGMLKWDKDNRIKIEDVLKSYFFKGCRNPEIELLPDDKLCKDVQEVLKVSEDTTKDKTWSELKGIILDHMIKKYPREALSGEWYPYVTSWRKHQNMTTISVLKTVSVLGTILVPLTLITWCGISPRTIIPYSLGVGCTLVSGLVVLDNVLK